MSETVTTVNMWDLATTATTMNIWDLDIIDIARDGNVVRYYLGENGKQWGDDWNDAPYEYNAGPVYQEYVRAIVDIAYPWQYSVITPGDSYEVGAECSKKDMMHGYVAMVICKTDLLMDWNDDFSSAVALKDKKDEVKHIYFGDHIGDIMDAFTGGVVVGWFSGEEVAANY